MMSPYSPIRRQVIMPAHINQTPLKIMERWKLSLIGTKTAFLDGAKYTSSQVQKEFVEILKKVPEVDVPTTTCSAKESIEELLPYLTVGDFKHLIEWLKDKTASDKWPIHRIARAANPILELFDTIDNHLAKTKLRRDMAKTQSYQNLINQTGSLEKRISQETYSGYIRI